MRRTFVLLTIALTWASALHAADGGDLAVPAMADAAPATGQRVRHQLTKYADTQVYHALYLPTNWQPAESRDKDTRYPVIVEYAGNRYGPDKNGDVCTGTPEGCKLGYGISGGERFIWICLPYVNAKEKRNQLTWWGDVGATVDYCKRAVAMVCDDFGGDPSAVFLTGFSRGAIACGYIGLHDGDIASLWCGFIPHSHFDGVRNWGYVNAVGEAAARRLRRGVDRPWFVTHESSAKPTRKYVERILGDDAKSFTFVSLPTPRHTDTWVLSDNVERRALRVWVERVLRERDTTRGKPRR